MLRETNHIDRAAPDKQVIDDANGVVDVTEDAVQSALEHMNEAAHGDDIVPVSRQVYRQAQRDNNKYQDWFYQADWKAWLFKRGPDGEFIRDASGNLKPSIFFKRVHSIIPFAAPVRHPGIGLNRTMKGDGKIVGQMAVDGIWDGKADWTTKPTTLEEALEAHEDGAALCIQGVNLIGLDCDIDKPELAQGTLDLINEHFDCPPSRRYRDNASRVLVPIWRADGEPLFAKISWVISVEDDNEVGKFKEVGKFEVLGALQQFVVEGMHKSGVPIKWINRPCDYPNPLEAIPKTTHTKLQAFLNDLKDYYETFGYQVKVVQGAGGTILRSSANENGTSDQHSGNNASIQRTAGARKLMGHPPHLASSTEDLCEALKFIPNTWRTHDEYFAFCCPLKAALGGDEKNYPIFLEYGLQWEKNTKEYVRQRWDSIRDSESGWPYLFALARSRGYKINEALPEWDCGEGAPPAGLAPEGVGDAAQPNNKIIQLTPFKPCDPKAIPPRRWLYGGHYIGGYISATVAPGGLGKSALVLVEASAMVTGQNLLGVEKTPQLGVLYVNLEDGMEEIERRTAAVRLHYKITNEQIGDRLFLLSGRDTDIVIAKDERGNFIPNAPLIANLRDEIVRNKIDVMIIDPLVASHAVPENDNNKMNAICKILRTLAEETGCAIELVHHVRKGGIGQTETSVDDARGAGAVINAVRSARVLNRMTKEDAALAGIAEDKRGYYFRADNGKANLAPHAAKSKWFRHASVDLGNDDPVTTGVVEFWQWPDPIEDVTPEHVRRVQDAISAGEWREDVRASNWAGYAIGDALGLDLTTAAGKAKAKALLKTWLDDRTLELTKIRDAGRKIRTFVVVGKRKEIAA